MGTMVRSSWTDDSGNGTSGTVINNSELQKIYDNIDAEVKSPTRPTIKTRDIIDQVYTGDEPYVSITQNSATMTLDLSNPSRNFKVALNATVTTLALTNLPPAGKIAVVTIRLDFSGVFDVTFPASVRWNQGVAPVLTKLNAKTDIFALTTWDGGTTWFGSSLGQNYTT